MYIFCATLAELTFKFPYAFKKNFVYICINCIYASFLYVKKVFLILILQRLHCGLTGSALQSLQLGNVLCQLIDLFQLFH